MFIGTKYLDIYTLMDNVAYFKKMLVRWVEKKQVREYTLLAIQLTY